MAQTTSGQWNTSPLEETNGNARRPPKRIDPYGSQERIPSASREPKTARRVPSDNYNIMSDSEEVKQRRMSLKTNNSTASKKRSRNTLREQAKAGAAAGNVDDSAWIHRDKLAQIEIQEMEEAGIYVRPSRRSMSADPHTSRRSSRSVSRSRVPISESPPDEPLPNGGYIAGYDAYEDKPLPRTPAAQEGDRDFDPDVDTEFRTPEEIAAENGAVRNQTVRPGTSRIPISKASPVPVPSNMKGRESPLPRSRHGSGAGSGNWDDMQYARRARSSSIGSQAILDEDAAHHTATLSGSPPKSRVPTKATPKSGARKGSVPNEASRPGSSYSRDRKPNLTPTSTAQRPGSRSGAAAKIGRPSTSHQHTPEGDPPWMDSMYKPDPRLPPDQQMLPTHAKRMMQEQWEKEGKSGTTYDRDLNLLTDKELPQPKLQANMPPIDPLNQERTYSPIASSPRKASPQIPSSATQGRAPPTPPPPPSPRPSTSGGLRLTPKIVNTPQMPGLASSPMATRVPVLDEKEEAQAKKGRCACCVVM